MLYDDHIRTGLIEIVRENVEVNIRLIGIIGVSNAISHPAGTLKAAFSGYHPNELGAQYRLGRT